MKLSHIALAVAALSAGQAFATTQIISGASASSINAAKALRQLCAANGGTYAIYKQDTKLNSLGNIFTATCSGGGTKTFDGLSGGIDQVRFNVSGGSLGAVTNSVTTAVARIDPSTATCTALGAGTEALAFALVNEMNNCGTSGTTLQLGDGGFLDVNADVFAAKNLSLAGADPAADFVQSNFLQAFGLGVSQPLYRALQAYQTAQGQLDPSCATTSGSNPVVYTASDSTLPLCQPSVSRAQIAALINNFNGNPKKAGANFLIGGTASTVTDLVGGTGGKAIVASQLPALNTNLTYCRRPNTSGTQASTELYFLANPTASGDLGGALTVSNPVTSPAADVAYGTTMKVRMNSGTSDVKNCMNNSATDTAYSFGTVSLENNPIGGSDTYRFVKINNVSPTEGVAGASNTVEAIAGRYDFVFETWMYCPAGTCAPILDLINTALTPGSSSPGLFLQSEAKANRGGKAQSPYVSTK
jgi:hypothetical protein